MTTPLAACHTSKLMKTGVPEVVRLLLRPEVGLGVGAPEQANQVLAGDPEAERSHEHGQQRGGSGVLGERPVDGALDATADGGSEEHPEHGRQPEAQCTRKVNVYARYTAST